MVNNLVVEFHWSFKQAAESTISDVESLFKSETLKRHQEERRRMFEALLKQIAKVR